MIQKVDTAYFELQGSYYEIGRQMAKLLADKQMQAPPAFRFIEEEIKNALAMINQYCPDLMEELRGYCDESGTTLQDNFYLWLTYLVPRCSSFTLLPEHTVNGHTLLARNYEFSAEMEDFHVYRVAPEGKYAHIGGSLLEFGRSEGINECGLALSMSSCGFPVSNIPEMRAPAIRGLNFCAVLRTVLENCSSVDEALDTLMKLPIGYNLNLILADRKKNIALFETMNGEKAVQRGGRADEPTFLCATNHIAIESFKDRESMGMRNSLVRLETIRKFVKGNDKMTEQQLRDFLLAKYPNGMTCWYYKDFFGTVKSIVMDVDDGRFSICWGGRAENCWEDFYVDKKVGNRNRNITIIHEQGNKEFFEFIPF
jgi:predicted choloylglycine hydrolase